MKTYTSEYDECLDDVTRKIEERLNPIQEKIKDSIINGGNVDRQAKLQHQEEVLLYVLNDIANMRGK